MAYGLASTKGVTHRSQKDREQLEVQQARTAGSSEGFASGGQDIGSPGRIREGAAPVLPPVIAISLSSGQLKLRFQGHSQLAPT